MGPTNKKIIWSREVVFFEDQRVCSDQSSIETIETKTQGMFWSKSYRPRDKENIETKTQGMFWSKSYYGKQFMGRKYQTYDLVEFPKWWNMLRNKWVFKL